VIGILSPFPLFYSLQVGFVSLLRSLVNEDVTERTGAMETVFDSAEKLGIVAPSRSYIAQNSIGFVDWTDRFSTFSIDTVRMRFLDEFSIPSLDLFLCRPGTQSQHLVEIPLALHSGQDLIFPFSSCA